MEENVLQINGRITINVDVSVKNIIYVKKTKFGILVHVVVKMENVYQVLCMIQRIRVMKLQTPKLSHKTEKQILMKKSSHKSKYLTLVPTNKSKEKLKKY